MKPFISTKFFGFFNYLLAAALIASPWMFGMVEISSAALLIPIYIGWLQFIMNVFSNNETSLIKQFPIHTHLTIDILMGFILFVSPWLYTFSDRIWAPQVIFGLILMGLAIFTKGTPFLGKKLRRNRDNDYTAIV